VLGTILPGLGHVHFTHGGPGSSVMNAIRPVGGFTPYIDNYPPKIEWVKFFLDQTNTEFTGARVSGLVDIRTHIRETNAADPPNVTPSTSNNGTYIAGYKILSADTTTVVYEPPSGGVRFRFDRKPFDSYVHTVFAPGSDLSTHIYTITNGDGADYVNGTLIVNNNAWNTNLLPVGHYVVMVFAEDTRGLTDTVYKPVEVVREDLVPPEVPELYSIINDSTNKFTVRWRPNREQDLLGYRLFFTVDGVTWIQRENEQRLTPSDSSISYVVVNPGTIFFRLAAVDSATPTNVSGFSSVYGIKLNFPGPKSLIVDGFTRTEGSGSWHEPSHPFVMSHGRSIPTNFSSCTHEAIIAGDVSLHDYDVVVWVLGDESITDRTFDSTEQELVKAYLRAGGKLFVSGSEVAWDLDRPSGPTQSDREFMHNFLKAAYVGDDSEIYTVVGAPSTIFQDVDLRYGIVAEGSPYEEDLPDYIAPQGGSSVVLHYGDQSSTIHAGVAFKGMFPGGTQPGAVVYMGFPFETIHTRANRDTLMRRAYQYFEILSGVEGDIAGVPGSFELGQNYPNPFNPSTAIGFQVTAYSHVRLSIYDLLGREVATLVNEVKAPGSYEVTWDASGMASGVYLYRLTSGGTTLGKRMMLLK
jgi:hypothetical protein